MLMVQVRVSLSILEPRGLSSAPSHPFSRSISRQFSETIENASNCSFPEEDSFSIDGIAPDSRPSIYIT